MVHNIDMEKQIVLKLIDVFASTVHVMGTANQQ